MADGAALRWALLALGLLLIVLCDSLHGVHRNPPDAAHRLSVADSGDRDGEQHPDQSAKPRRRPAAGPVHDGDTTPATVPAPLSALPPALVRSLPAYPPPRRSRAFSAVPRLSRGQDPPAVQA